MEAATSAGTAEGLAGVASKHTWTSLRYRNVRRLFYYFRPDVLSVFHNRPDKYAIETDDFWGDVRIRDGYFHPSTAKRSRLGEPFAVDPIRALMDGMAIR